MQKVCIITGAGHGMGRAAAAVFAGYGARLVLADIDDDSAEAAAREARALGVDAIAVHVDITIEEDVKQMVQAAVDTFGRLDCAYNNVGGSTDLVSVHELSRKAWESNVSLNLTGQWLCVKHEIPAMLKGGGGSIVNTASGAGVRGTAMLSAYAAAKAGVINLTQTTSTEYAKQGVRCNAICPGVIDTGSPGLVKSAAAGINWAERMNIPAGRIGRAEEVAELAAWLCSPLCSFLTGQAIAVDGGQLARQ